LNGKSLILWNFVSRFICFAAALVVSLLLSSEKSDATVLTGVGTMFRASARLLDGSGPHLLIIQALFELSNISDDASFILLS
jgi:hypothetical protein